MTAKMTNFEQVCLLNTVAGNTDKGNWSDVIKQTKYLYLEVAEFAKNILEGNYHGIRDDLADILVTAYGVGGRAGFDVDIDFAAVMEALFTRFDKTLEDANLTKEKYLRIGVETYIHAYNDGEHIYYVTKSSKDQYGHDGESYPKDKFLKSHGFRTEVFDALEENVEQSLQDTASSQRVVYPIFVEVDPTNPISEAKLLKIQALVDEEWE